MSTKKVCVTGAEGFIGSHIVKELLQNGYQVNATVMKKTESTQFLNKLPNASNNLNIFEANLLQDDCFCSPFKNCQGVFHVASPTFFESKDPENELVKPARDGTINVLRCCQKVGCVKRIILTSDLVAASQTTSLKTEGGVITEDSWSDEGYLRSQNKWYHLSKLLSEQAAWHFVKDSTQDINFTLISVLPSLVIGPMLQPSLNFSNKYIFQCLTGDREGIPAKPAFITDVRDAALVHLRLYEKENLESGRFICNGTSCFWKDICDRLRKIAPGASVPTRMIHTEKRTAPSLEVSSKKLENTIDVKFRDLNETLQDVTNSFVEHNWIPSERLKKQA